MRATLNDIAKQAGVTMATASYVLNNKPGTRISAETRRRVLELADKLNYQPDHHARSLATGRSNTIGIVFCGNMEEALRDPYSVDLMRGVILEASNVEQAIQVFVEGRVPRQHGVDGWIAVMAIQPLPPSQVAGLPILYCDPLYRLGENCIWSRNEDAGALLAEQVAHRHKRVLFLLHESISQSPHSYLKRSDGFQEAFCRRRGPTSVFTDSLPPTGPASETQQFVEKWIPVLKRGEITAIVCASDMLARKVADLVSAEGMAIPQTIEIAGFDNTIHSHIVAPTISTIDMGAEKMGVECVRHILAQIEGKPSPFAPPEPVWIPRMSMPDAVEAKER